MRQMAFEYRLTNDFDVYVVREAELVTTAHGECLRGLYRRERDEHWQGPGDFRLDRVTSLELRLEQETGAPDGRLNARARSAGTTRTPQQEGQAGSQPRTRVASGSKARSSEAMF